MEQYFVSPPEDSDKSLIEMLTEFNKTLSDKLIKKFYQSQIGETALEYDQTL